MSAATLSRFDLVIMHPFYADGACRDFMVQPSERTHRCLLSARWVLKGKPDGFTIVGAASAVRMDEPLIFFMRLRNPKFAYFTAPLTTPSDVPTERSLAWFSPGTGEIFKAASATLLRDPRTPDKAPVIRSNAAPVETIGTSQDAEEAMTMGNLFGVIQLTSFSLPASQPKPATIQFESQQVRWAYQINGETGLAIRPGIFGSPIVSGSDTRDKIDFARVEADGNTTFTSKSSLPCFEHPRQNLVLCTKGSPGRDLLQLPSPALDSLSLKDPKAPTLTCVIKAAGLTSPN
jgi:hypothetical protein